MAEKTEIYKLIYKTKIANIFQKNIRILGRYFFEKNKYKGRMIINNKMKPLKDEIKLEDAKEEEVIIKIIFFQRIKNKSFMFEDCISLTSIFQKEKYYIYDSIYIF